MIHPLVGKSVVVHLIHPGGRRVTAVLGRALDVVMGVEMRPGLVLDLVHVTGIAGYQSPHLESPGEVVVPLKDVYDAERYLIELSRN